MKPYCRPMRISPVSAIAGPGTVAETTAKHSAAAIRAINGLIERPSSYVFRPLRSPRRGDVTIAQIAAPRAVLLVRRLERREAVLRAEPGMTLVIVETRHVLAANRILHRTVGRTDRGEAVSLLHVLGDLETAQAFDLPLRQAGPTGIGAPDHMIGAESLDQRSHQRGGKTRLGHGRPGEKLTEIAIDVGHAIFLRDRRELADPRDPAGLVPL